MLPQNSTSEPHEFERPSDQRAKSSPVQAKYGSARAVEPPSVHVCACGKTTAGDGWKEWGRWKYHEVPLILILEGMLPELNNCIDMRWKARK